MNRILVTGGVGFIGSNLVDYFLEKGYKITIMDNFSREGSEINAEYLLKKHKNLDIERVDIRDIKKLKNILKKKKIDTIFHAAGQTAVTTSVEYPREDFEVNALGTFNVLEAARLSVNNPSIIFTSTNKVYGNNVNKIPINERDKRYEFGDEKFKFGIPEDFPTDANEHTPYGCSKYTADIYMRDYCEIFGLKTLVFRMSCIYGPMQNGTEDQGWLAHFLISGLKNNQLTIFGDGKQVRDVLFASDLCRLFELALKNIDKVSGEVYNVGGGHNNTLSLIELLELMGKKNIEPKYSFSDWRPADQKVYISDIRKAKKDFKWEPKIGPEEGVEKFLKWFKGD